MSYDGNMMTGLPGKEDGSRSRRQFLKLGLAGAASLFLPGRAYASLLLPRRALSFVNSHTGERLETVYYSGGVYLPSSLREINQIMCDRFTGAVGEMDPNLLDVLHALSQRLATGAPFHIISGYRTPSSNEKLRSSTGGVARNSFHLEGKAVDVRLPGLKTDVLRDEALALNVGGVGYYPKSDFVHLDVGPVRHWQL